MFLKKYTVDRKEALLAITEPNYHTIFEGFDEEIVNELRTRARNCLLSRAIATEEKLADIQPEQDLLDLTGMSKELAVELAVRGVLSREDLAEQSIDDLLEIEGMDEDRAGKLIMAARAHWFE